MNKLEQFGIFIAMVLLCGCKPELASSKPDDAAPDTGEVGELPEKAAMAEKAAVEDETAPAANGTAPLLTDGSIQLENAAGKVIAGQIIAKRGNEIRFRRDSDGVEFWIPVSSLSVDWQLDLALVAEFGAPKSPAGPGGEFGSDESGSRLFSHQKPWHDSSKAAFEAAAESGKPTLFIFLGTPLLDENDPDSYDNYEAAVRDCKSLDRTVLDDRGFKSFVGETFEVAFFDLRGKESLEPSIRRPMEMEAIDLGVYNYPVFVILNAERRELGRISGYDRRGPSLLADRLEDILNP